MRHLTGGRPTPREEIERELLPRLLAEYERHPGMGRWAAIERSTGAFVGWVALTPRDRGGPNDAELGYRLRRAAWGRGYATEGSRELIRRAFTEHGIER